MEMSEPVRNRIPPRGEKPRILKAELQGNAIQPGMDYCCIGRRFLQRHLSLEPLLAEQGH